MDTIVISGQYQGPRIVLQNATGKTLIFKNARIQSTHPQDALCVDGDVSGFHIQGALQLDGALTYWGRVDRCTVSGILSDGAHVGIRATSDLAHAHITISRCTIRNSTLEGIYIGPSAASPRKLRHVSLIDVLIEDAGWDGAQLGNCEDCRMERVRIVRAGKAKKEWQDYGITLNPGGRYYLKDIRIEQTDKKIQVLDSRLFHF